MPTDKVIGIRFYLGVIMREQESRRAGEHHNTAKGMQDKVDKNMEAEAC